MARAVDSKLRIVVSLHDPRQGGAAAILCQCRRNQQHVTSVALSCKVERAIFGSQSIKCGCLTRRVVREAGITALAFDLGVRWDLRSSWIACTWADVEIDKINKPTLPIATGDLSSRTTVVVLVALVFSLAMGVCRPVLGTEGLNVGIAPPSASRRSRWVGLLERRLEMSIRRIARKCTTITCTFESFSTYRIWRFLSAAV